jgi:putative phosphoesterase
MLARILVIGDTHIPDRAFEIPRELVSRIEREKPWELVVFTGDLTGQEVLRWVRSLGERVYIVRGNMDYLPLPKTAKFEVEGLNVGVHHGDGVYPRGDVLKLSSLAEKMGENVLITGHTHSDFARIGVKGKVLLLNPGSLTGVWGGGGGSYTPSYMVVETHGATLAVLRVKLRGASLIEESDLFEWTGESWLSK